MFGKLFIRCLILVFVVLISTTAHARPEYARKEGRACQYCHESFSPGSVNPKTGMRELTTRNARGLYYAKNNYSLAGYVERSAAGRAVQPSFKYLWKADFTDLPRRIAVADVVGDGTLRLILLQEKPDSKESSTLTVRKWNGKEFVTEFTGEVKAPADKMQVGAFGGAGKPAVIVTPDALWKWDGKTFVRTPAPRPLALFGAARLRSGEEQLLLADSPQTIKAHRVNPAAANWLGEGQDAPSARQVAWEEMHAAPEFFDKMEMPAVLGSGGLIGLWDVKKNGGLALYHTRLQQDFDVKTGANNQPQFVLKAEYYAVALLDTQSETGVPFWSTPRFETRPLDVALESPRGDRKPGLLVLTAEPKGSKTRTLYFFGLE